MLLNKTSAEALKFFVGHITGDFTLREVAKELNMHVSLAHRATRPLLENRIIKQDKHKSLSLNYKSCHETLAFAEYLRRDNLLGKRRYEELRLFSEEIISKIKEDSFVLLLFGSIVDSDNPRDIDVLLIVDDAEKIRFHEKFIGNIASKYSLPFEERVISFENVYEMLSKRDEMNMMNEILNKHIILYGAELFYRLLERGR